MCEIVVQGVRLAEGSCDVHCDRLRTRRHCHSWPRSTPRPRWRGLAVRRLSFSLTPAGRPHEERFMRDAACTRRARWVGDTMGLTAEGGGSRRGFGGLRGRRGGTYPELSGAETRQSSGETIRSIASTQACQAPHWDWWGQEKPLLQPWDRSASSGTNFPSLGNFP